MKVPEYLLLQVDMQQGQGHLAPAPAATKVSGERGDHVPMRQMSGCWGGVVGQAQAPPNPVITDIKMMFSQHLPSFEV
jgi:hypothetical protein